MAAAYFVDSAASWGREGRWVSGFGLAYALAFAGGFAIQVVAALCVLGLTRAIRRHGLVDWIAAGGAIGAALPWGLARLGYLLEGIHFPHDWQGVKTALMFPLMGAMMYEVRPAWVLAAVGAATAGTVRLFSRRLIASPRRS